MKKRANLITRVALAATIFVTALAGVTPMTAKAAPNTEVSIKVTDSATIKLTFDLDGGAWTSTAAANATESASKTYTIPSVKKDGYIFDGWGTPSNSVGTISGDTFTAADTVTDGATSTSVATWKAITLESISLTPATKTAYTVGEKFDTTGMTVTATYSDGNTKSVTSSSTYSPSGALTTDDTTITVKYSEGGVEKTATQSITVTAPSVANPTYTPASGSEVSPGETITLSSTTTGATFVHTGPQTTEPSAPTATYGTAGATFTIPVTAKKGETYYVKAIAVSGSTASGVVPASFTVKEDAVTGTSATLKSFSWNSGSLDLGGIRIGADALHNKTTPDKPALVFPVNSEKQFDNGITRDNIIKEIDKADDLSVTLRVNETDVTFKLDSVKWDYTYTEGANQPLTSSAYNRNETKKQEFYIYSDPLQLKNGNNVYSITSGDLGPATYVRLKLHVVVNAEGEAATNTTTGSGNVAAPTFTPASGAYVHPGQRISFASTTAGVSFRSDSGDKMPTTSSGTSGAAIAIPSGASGTYKLNAIAYTGTNNYSSVASATYTVVGSSAANYTLTEGNAQQVNPTLPASFTFSGDHTKFRQLQVDGVVVPSGYYQVAQGSTIITLQPSYLATLTAGTHTIEAFFDDGYATGSFTLTSSASNTPNMPTNINNPTNSDNSTLPGSRGGNTDDRSQLVIMFVLLGMLIAGFVVSVYYKNEKLRRNRYMD